MHNHFLRISIGCVNKVHPPLVCPVCESRGRGCPRDSVIEVVLCIIIVPGLMNKEPPPPPPPSQYAVNNQPTGLYHAIIR